MHKNLRMWTPSKNSKFYLSFLRKPKDGKEKHKFKPLVYSFLLISLHSKVIPLSQRSGIVEWCENTVPLGEYLIGRPGTKTGAHSRYYPEDWTSLDCRNGVKVPLHVTLF